MIDVRNKSGALRWAYFPRNATPPVWVRPLLDAIDGVFPNIDSRTHRTLESNEVVAALREPLDALGWLVEAGKRTSQKIVRPVLFGDDGQVRVKQEIDGWQEDVGAILEIESGRAIMGNAVYRDLVRASLVADARYLVLGVRQECRYRSGESRTAVSRDFDKTRDLLDSLYGSGRLQLPFEGVLVFGW